MSLQPHGKSTLEVEVTHISSHGIWLLAHEREMFLSYTDFPWFKEVPVSKIINVKEQAKGHYYWPDLDVDLSREIIEHPDRFPLVS
jgi:hypothetical protein